MAQPRDGSGGRRFDGRPEGLDRRPRWTSARLRPLASCLALGWLAVACSRSSITSSGTASEMDLLAADQPRDANPVVTISRTGVSPEVSHLNRNVPVRFVNQDAVAHTYASAPALGFGPCPEADGIGRLEPGDERTIAVSRTTICAFEDSSQPGVRLFQGLLAVH